MSDVEKSLQEVYSSSLPMPLNYYSNCSIDDHSWGNNQNQTNHHNNGNENENYHSNFYSDCQYKYDKHGNIIDYGNNKNYDNKNNDGRNRNGNGNGNRKRSASISPFPRSPSFRNSFPSFDGMRDREKGKDVEGNKGSEIRIDRSNEMKRDMEKEKERERERKRNDAKDLAYVKINNINMSSNIKENQSKNDIQKVRGRSADEKRKIDSGGDDISVSKNNLAPLTDPGYGDKSPIYGSIDYESEDGKKCPFEQMFPFPPTSLSPSLYPFLSLSLLHFLSLSLFLFFSFFLSLSLSLSFLDIF